MAKIVVFVGSVREGRQGRKVADWVVDALNAREHDVTLIDPLEHEELLVLRQMYKSIENPSEDMKSLRKAVDEADGYVLCTPEYNHAFSGALKNALDHWLEEYFFKPSVIVSYSAGNFGGIRATEHLRAVVAEMGMSAIPTSLAVSAVHKTFDDEGVLVDESYDDRLAKMLDEFEWYVRSLAIARQKGTPN